MTSRQAGWAMRVMAACKRPQPASIHSTGPWQPCPGVLAACPVCAPPPLVSECCAAVGRSVLARNAGPALIWPGSSTQEGEMGGFGHRHWPPPPPPSATARKHCTAAARIHWALGALPLPPAGRFPISADQTQTPPRHRHGRTHGRCPARPLHGAADTGAWPLAQHCPLRPVTPAPLLPALLQSPAT